MFRPDDNRYPPLRVGGGEGEHLKDMKVQVELESWNDKHLLG